MKSDHDLDLPGSTNICFNEPLKIRRYDVFKVLLWPFSLRSYSRKTTWVFEVVDQTSAVNSWTNVKNIITIGIGFVSSRASSWLFWLWLNYRPGGWGIEAVPRSTATPYTLKATKRCTRTRGKMMTWCFAKVWWPEHGGDPSRSCCISVDAARREKHIETVARAVYHLYQEL